MNRAWWLVGLLSATATASYLCRVNLSVAGVLMMREFGLSQEAMGRVFSSFILGYALCQVPAGMLADRFGAIRVLACAALAWVAFTAVIASLPASFAALLAVRCLLGVAEAPTFPAAAQAVFRWIPAEQRGRANGVVVTGIGIGSAIAPPLITFAMMRWGWRAALLVSAIPACAVGLTWLAVRAPCTHVAAPVKSDTADGLPRSLSFILLTLSYTLEGYVSYIFVFWFYLYLVDVRHFDLLRGAAFASLPWLLTIVSIPLGGLVFDRLRKAGRIVPMAGLAGSGIMIAAGAHVSNAYLAAVCLALATALVLSVEGAFWATMTRIAGPRSGAAGGIMNMGSNLGGLISPALTPVLAAWLGWEAALLVAAAVAVVAALLWLGITPEEAHHT